MDLDAADAGHDLVDGEARRAAFEFAVAGIDRSAGVGRGDADPDLLRINELVGQAELTGDVGGDLAVLPPRSGGR